MLAIDSPAVLVLAGLGVLPPVPEDGLPVLRADFGVSGGMLRPIGKALSHRTTVATAQVRAMEGANGHVSPHGPSPNYSGTIQNEC